MRKRDWIRCQWARAVDRLVPELPTWRERCLLAGEEVDRLTVQMRRLQEYNETLHAQSHRREEEHRTIVDDWKRVAQQLEQRVTALTEQCEASDQKCRVLQNDVTRLEGVERELRQANHYLILADRESKRTIEKSESDRKMLWDKITSLLQFMNDTIETVRSYHRGDTPVKGVVEYLEANLQDLHKRRIIYLADLNGESHS